MGCGTSRKPDNVESVFVANNSLNKDPNNQEIKPPDKDPLGESQEEPENQPENFDDSMIEKLVQDLKL